MSDSKSQTTADTDREVAIREILKDVLANLIYATTCYEIASGLFTAPINRRDPEDVERLRQFRRAEDRGRGAYRDIFCADEWRHDREGAFQAVAETLKSAGIDASESLSRTLVEAVMRSMPGARTEDRYGH